MERRQNDVVAILWHLYNNGHDERVFSLFLAAALRGQTEYRTERRGWDGVRGRRGVAFVQATILTAGWRGLLAQLHGPVRSVEEKSGEVAYAAKLAVVGIYTSRARIRLERPKQIFGASPLKTRNEPTDELICFPTTPLSSLSFFDYPPLPSPVFR